MSYLFLSCTKVEVIDQVVKGNKVAAIKYIIDHSDYSLKEAKEIVDFIENPENDIDQLIAVEQVTDPAFTETVPDTRQYKTIQLDHAKQQVVVIYTDGQKQPINEFHPEWNQVMQFFYGKSYPSVAVLFAERKIEEDRLSNNDSFIEADAQVALAGQSARNQSGVEDLTQKSPLPKLLIVAVVVILVVLYVLFRN